MPQRVVDPRGESLFTGSDVSNGQQVFLHNGLMEYGSVFGHGAYLGPDFTADYLRRASDIVERRLRRRRAPTRRRAGRSRTSARTATTSAAGTLTLQRAAGRGVPAARRRTTARFFSDPTTEHGLRPDAITDRNELRQLTAFFGWTAWAASTERPGPRLLLHQQLAARAARRQQADRQRDRLERALADRAARRDRDPVRRLRPLALRSAGTGASRRRCRSARPATSRSRRRSAPAPGSSSSWRRCS